MAEVKYNVAVDIGNSLIKVAAFEDDKITQKWKLNSLGDLVGIADTLNNARWIISSVKNDIDDINQILSSRHFIYLTTQTPLPIDLDYLTPNTLGVDRIAAVAGAFCEYKKSCLVIDAGTCITYDHINQSGTYLGGAISPGLKMRLKAMHSFTGRLPDISDSWENIPANEWGRSTQGCLIKGALDGAINEIEGFITHFQKDNADLAVILTGGDTNYFESKLKAPIFADFDLVLKGLNTILNHNK